MIAARWFSTVRWLMPRSAAIFLLGAPARTSAMISRCRGVKPARWLAAVFPPGDQPAGIAGLFDSAFDAGKQFATADRLLDEVRSARLHGLNRDRHVAAARDHDCRQPMPRQLPQQFEPAHSRQVRVDQQACSGSGAIVFEECLAGCIVCDGPAILLQQAAKSLPHIAVVVDDKDERRIRRAGRFKLRSTRPAIPAGAVE